MRFLSPLRYPGGKAKLAPYFGRLIDAQKQPVNHYAEPFAGGAGAGLHLLHSGKIQYLHINDINPGIAAFWRCVFFDTGSFIERVMTSPIDVPEWWAAREVYDSPAGHSDLDLGFATFYLNRTNRSGILTARPIGGLDQAGRWKIDARFNKVDLVARIRLLRSYAASVQVTQMDASDFLWSLESFGSELLAYVDPPYLVQGDDLYLHAYSESAHLNLATQLAEIRLPWVLTYDSDPRISEVLYSDQRCAEFGISHTAQVQHIGKEYVVFSKDLIVPDMQITARSEAAWLA
ncbi:DNA adenine methylase [Paenarthrobacter sp. NPDC089989]|uniref:DNA adenine methylase n=1 Tax=unclassified Paenarthrobacter TaxID=2634190 RepID=UPI003819967C